MREILFRGKHIHAFPKNKHLDGTWVYGYLSGGDYINTVDDGEYGEKYASEMLIDPQTICQYTGMEKEGRKLYENDIVECRGNGRHFQTCIKWDEDAGGFMLQDTESSWCGLDALGEGGIYKDYRIVGNIFDNPELGKRE